MDRRKYTVRKKVEIPVLVILTLLDSQYPQWTTGKLPETYNEKCVKVWTDQERFRYMLKYNFLKYALSGWPLLLTLDRHSML